MSIRSLCQLNGHFIILHKRILIKTMSDLFAFRCQPCSYVNIFFIMLAVNIKICIPSFSPGMPFKIHFLIKR